MIANQKAQTLLANQETEAQPLRISKLQRLLLGVAAIGVGAAAAVAVTSISSTFKLIVLVLGMGAAAATALRAEWGLLALVFMGYTRFSDVMVRNGAPSTAQPFIGLLLLVIFMRWIMYNERPQGWLKGSTLVLLYGLTGLLTIMYARDVYRAQTGVIEYFKDAIFVTIILMLIRKPETLRRAIWALLAAGIFMATLTTWQQFTGTFDNNYFGFAKAGRQQIVAGQEDDYRIAGPIGDPNFYAQVLLVLVPIGLDRMWNEKKRALRWVAGWAVVVCTLSVFFTFSRGAFIGLVMVLGVMFFRNPPKPIVMLLTVLIMIPLFQFLPPGYTDRLKTIPEAIPGLSDTDVREEASFRGRSSAQLAGLMMFLDHPIFGVGVLNFGVYYQEYSRQLGLDNSGWDQSPHNLYLEILTEKGLIGLSAFFALIFGFFYGLSRARRQFIQLGNLDYANMVLAFSIGIFGYLFTSMFLHMSYPRFFWVLIGIGFAMPNIAQTLAAQQREATHGK